MPDVTDEQTDVFWNCVVSVVVNMVRMIAVE